jgi:hypothetical protein
MSAREFQGLLGWTQLEYNQWLTAKGYGTRSNYKRRGIPAAIAVNDLLKYYREGERALTEAVAAGRESAFFSGSDLGGLLARLRRMSRLPDAALAVLLELAYELWEIQVSDPERYRTVLAHIKDVRQLLGLEPLAPKIRVGEIRTKIRRARRALRTPAALPPSPPPAPPPATG